MRLPLAHCVLRPLEAHDAEPLARHGNNPQVAANLRDVFPSPYRTEDARAYIASRQASTGPPITWAIEVEGEAAGVVSLKLGTDIHRLSAEIGYWLGQPFWGRGIMSEAVAAATDRAFVDHRLTRVFATPFAASTASHRVLEKAGYLREGVMKHSAVKHGKLINQILYAKTQPLQA